MLEPPNEDLSITQYFYVLDDDNWCCSEVYNGEWDNLGVEEIDERTLRFRHPNVYRDWLNSEDW